DLLLLLSTAPFQSKPFIHLFCFLWFTFPSLSIFIYCFVNVNVVPTTTVIKTQERSWVFMSVEREVIDKQALLFVRFHAVSNLINQNVSIRLSDGGSILFLADTVHPILLACLNLYSLLL